MSRCDCRTRVSALLAEHNTRIAPIYSLSDSGVGLPWPIATTQIETGRGKPKAMGLFAGFCPFCGASLAKPADTVEVANG